MVSDISIFLQHKLAVAFVLLPVSLTTINTLGSHSSPAWMQLLVYVFGLQLKSAATQAHAPILLHCN